MIKKDYLSQRLQDEDIQEQRSHKVHDDTEQEGLLRSRINPALRSSQNKEYSSSELHIENRSNQISVFPENGIRNEISNGSSSGLNIHDKRVETHNENNSHFIRSRVSQWENVKESLHSRFLSLINFDELKGITDLQLNNRLRISTTASVCQSTKRHRPRKEYTCPPRSGWPASTRHPRVASSAPSGR